MADIHVKGLAELQRTLQNLPVKMEKNIIRGALRAGAKEVADEAKARVAYESGDLRRSIRVSGGAKKNGRVYANIKAGGGKAWYARFVEFGTKRHVISGSGQVFNKKGISLGMTAINRRLSAGLLINGNFVAKVNHPGAQAKPFMRPALDNKAGAAIDTMAAYIRTRLDKLK